jgi:hypothetical protein
MENRLPRRKAPAHAGFRYAGGFFSAYPPKGFSGLNR